MARRKTPTAMSQPRPRLRRSREDARLAIEERIAVGEDIARRINAGAHLPGAADDFDGEISRWSSYNRELLHQMFDTDEVADDYGRVFAAWVSRYETDFQRLRRELARLSNLINDLKIVAGKLDLYELVPENTPWPEIATFGAATPQNWPKPGRDPQPIVQISNSTFGALNLGEVKGSIHAHVASISGASADAFRQAIAAMTEVVAGATELTEQRRQEVLQYIDALAEQAGHEPAKRKTPIIKGMLLAIPTALDVSAHALDAWDKYGPAIRSHFGV
jgi:hypothetical protein